jgi:hypothetical protein
MNTNDKTILVSISCFEDTDIIKTVNNMLGHARNPHRIRIIAIIQTDDPSKFNELYGAEKYMYPRAWAEGCGKARAAAIRRYAGEDYFFQTDSHMRFMPNWDEMLINELEKCPSERPILTTLPPGFVIKTEQLLGHGYHELRVFKFYRHLPVVAGHIIIDLDPRLPPKQIPCLAGGVLFSKGKLCEELKYDPYMFFHGEELSTNLRLWTMGYDNFSPRFCFCWHAYRANNEDMHPNIDHYITKEHSMYMHERSLARVHVLSGVLKPEEVKDPDWLVDLDVYGLGTVRTVKQWEEKFGISLKNETFPPPC